MTRRRYPAHLYAERAQIDMPLVRCAGFRSLRRPIGLEEHIHEGFELTYLAEGEVTWSLVSGRDLNLCGRSLAVIQPGVRHHGEWGIIRPCRLFWLVIEPDVPSPERNSIFSAAHMRALAIRFRACGNCVVGVDEPGVACFERLLDALESWQSDPGDEGRRARLRARICEVVLDCDRAFGAARAPEEDAPLLKSLEAFLAGNLGAPIGVREMAESVGMTTATFSRRFKSLTGLTPADHLRRLRCRRACDLLRATDRSITGLALELGFATSQHFARVFCAYTGMAPTVYRKRVRAWSKG